jgi:hypothetical protein
VVEFALDHRVSLVYLMREILTESRQTAVETPLRTENAENGMFDGVFVGTSQYWLMSIEGNMLGELYRTAASEPSLRRLLARE